VSVMAGSSSSGIGGVQPSSKQDCPWSFLSVSSWYVGVWNLKEWCPDYKSRTSLVPVAHWRPVVALETEVSGIGGTPQGTARVEMVGAGTRLGGCTGISLQDLVVHNTGASVFGSAAPAPGSSGAMSPGLFEPYETGSPGSLPPTINRRWVKDEAESACLHVTTVEWLLHEALASIHCNILHQVRVSLRREEKFLPVVVSVFSAPARYRVVKIMCSYSEVVL
jgi:hypothetical protein